jgi:hypothetical protein
MRCNVFAPRTIISLIFCLSIISENSKKKNNILILSTSKKDFDAKLIKLLLPYLKIFFFKIFFLKETLNQLGYCSSDIYNKNFITRLFYLHRRVSFLQQNKTLRTISEYDIENFYGGGNLLEEVFYLLLKKKPNFFYVEHGIGNIISFIKFEKLFIFKKIYFNILRSLFYFKVINYFPVIYSGYMGVLNQILTKKIYINKVKVPSLLLKNIFKVIKDLSKICTPFINKKIKNTKYIFLRLENLDLKENNRDFNLLLNKTIKLIEKDETILMKLHPHDVNNYKTINFLKNFYRVRNIKFILIKDKCLSKVPAEILIFQLKIKKVISLVSAVPLFSSCLFKNVQNYMFLDYSLKYPIASLPELDSANKFLYKNFRRINFI